MKTKHKIVSIILFLVLLFSCTLNAQEIPAIQDQFPIGAFMPRFLDEHPGLMNSFDSTGMNTIICRADENTKSLIANYNVIAQNTHSPNEYISHYATGFYSEWQAEQNQTETNRVGIKHIYGDTATWKGEKCWSTINASAPACSLMFGPHYRQEKKYKQFYNDDPVSYVVRYNMALDYNAQQVDPEDTVCIIKVVFRYADIDNSTPGDYHMHDAVFKTKALKVSDFDTAHSFKDFYFGTTITERPYQYPSLFIPNSLSDKLEQAATADTTYSDVNGDNGIQFMVDWLGVGTLYINKVEIYDNLVWRFFIDNPALVATQVKNYATSFSNWPNLKYWYASDEPSSLDAYAPMHIVDSLVRSVNSGPIITEFYPPWRTTVNGDTLIKQYSQIAKPQKLMIDQYPISTSNDPPLLTRLESLRKNFTLAHNLQPGFWYVGQGFGEQMEDGTWCTWRLPDSTELKATVMLALAHGIKGLMFFKYYPRDSLSDGRFNCSGLYTEQGIVDIGLNKSQIWYLIKNNLAPRLKGNLGTTLLNLDYTGSYVQILNGTIPPDIEIIPSSDYLTISGTGQNYNFYAGLLNQKNQITNKYFLLTNLNMYEDKTVSFSITNNFGNNNIRVKDVENSSNIDTTISSQLLKTIIISKGEGYLFQVAPVVKYGGKLLYNETTTNGITLYDKMSIESGATLTVNGRYYANADITVKAGGKLKYGIDNSKIIFNNGAKLILEGNAQVYGTSSTNKLNLQYDASTSIGIVVNPGASPIISYCNITGPLNGISVENEATINVSNTSISNCSNTGIALFHFGNGDSFLTLSTPNIYKCSISNCGTAISTVNCSEVIIKENNVTQCNLGLYFNMVNSAYISSNTILGWQSATGSPMPGISMSSSGGYLRNNTIRYHNFGVLLAYASPDLGVNTIENNYKCGVYSGLGSYPNLAQQLANPQCWYPIGGCNVIKNNGTFTQFPPSTPSILPDGAEIFLNSGDVLLSYGFNEISDD